MIEFRLPSLGADMEEGKLLEWKVRPGDPVKRGQVVAVVDTAKAAVEIECWSEGIVCALLVAPGETVPVGTVLATLREAGEASETAAPGEREAPAAEPAAAEAAAPCALAPGGRRHVSPAARRRAEELGVDVDTVAGSGPEGSVTLADVERTAAEKVSPAGTAIAASDRVAQMRRAIAAAMSRSKREIPHYYLSEPVPMRRATDWLAQVNAGRPVTERLLMAALQLKAVARALVGFPELNGHYCAAGFRPAAAVHIGVAISLRQGGLVAPALHDVGEKTLDQLMRELADLVKRARAGSLRGSELQDATITVTNLGEQGVATVHGIIHPPQVALVGFGRIMVQPWVEEGALTVMPVVTASLAADHRVSEGHRGARFLAALRDWLQRPEEL